MKTRIVVITIALILTSCSANHTSLLKKNEIKKYQTIAVATFRAPTNAVESGEIAADMVAAELMRKGYDVIERVQLAELMKEQKLSMSGIIRPESMNKLGEIYGVKGIVTGAVGDFKLSYRSNQFMTVPVKSASVTIKLIDIESGRLLWMGGESIEKIWSSYNKVMKKSIRKTMKHFPKMEVVQ